MLDKDHATTFLGILIAVLHQGGLVGTVPTTKTEWLHTGASLGIALLGYLTNKV